MQKSQGGNAFPPRNCFTMNCPNCSEQLSERGSFCKACAAQVRCMNCRELLEPAAKACVECGTKVGETPHQPDRRETPQTVLGANRNTISFSEDRKNRRFEASFTDSAMNGLGDVFAEFLSQRGGVGRISSTTAPHRSTNGKEAPVLDATHQLPAAGEVPAGPAGATVAPPANTLVGDKARIMRVFAKNGDQLEVSDNRLKASTCREYQRRLTYLTLYANELNGKAATPRSEVTAILKGAKVLDSNARAWIGRRVGFSVDEEDRFKLNAAAREEAIKILDEIADSNLVDSWNPDTKVPRARAKKA